MLFFWTFFSSEKNPEIKMYHNFYKKILYKKKVDIDNNKCFLRTKSAY